MANLNAPVVSWWNVDKVNPANTNTKVVAQPYDFGVVDAGYVPEEKDYYSFLIFNNKKSGDIAPQMEDVTIGVKDMSGGNGKDSGAEVWSINGDTKWFWAKVESLGQTDADFSMVGGDLTKPIGTNKKTVHPDVAKAVPWVASTSFNVGDVLKPTVENGFIYKVTASTSTTGVVEPTWSTVEGAEVTDGSIKYVAIKKEVYPTANNIILGGANDGTLANAGGNYVHLTMKIEVPLDAKSGRQNMKLRTSYRYI